MTKLAVVFRSFADAPKHILFWRQRRFMLRRRDQLDLSGPTECVNGAVLSQLNRAILLCDVIPDGKN